MPQTPLTPATRLAQTMDGAQIRAQHVVGRQSVGGRDIPLPSKALEEIAVALTGHGIVPKSQQDLKRDVGRIHMRKKI